MRFHYGGKYRTEDDLKAKKEQHDGAVPFREPDPKKFAIIANGGCAYPDAERCKDLPLWFSFILV